MIDDSGSAGGVGLLPCPFCGGVAKLISNTSSTVQCQNDQCIIGDPSPFNDFSHRTDAIAAWNTRLAAPAEVDARVEALDPATVRQCADYLRGYAGGHYMAQSCADALLVLIGEKRDD